MATDVTRNERARSINAGKDVNRRTLTANVHHFSVLPQRPVVIGKSQLKASWLWIILMLSRGSEDLTQGQDHSARSWVPQGWHRFRRSLGAVGVVYTCQTVIKNIFPRWFISCGSFYVVDLNIQHWDGSDWSEDGIRWAKPADAEKLAAINAMHMTLDAYAAHGSKICVAEADGEIVGFNIYDTNYLEQYNWLLYCMAEDALWGTDVWVAPEHRGQQLHRAMRSFMLSRLSKEGYRHLMGSIDAQNLASLRSSLSKTNVAGAFTYFRLSNLTFLWTDGRLRIGFWRPGHRLNLHSDNLKADPDKKYGRYKVQKLKHRLSKPRH